MVFLSGSFGIKAAVRRVTMTNKGPERFWRKRRLFRMTAHYFGRKRNCYSVAIKYFHRALQYATKARKLRIADNNMLYGARTDNAAKELGIDGKILTEGLDRSRILLTNKSLSDLAIWEPRSFKALANFAWNRSKVEGIAGVEKLGTPPGGVVLRGMIKK